MNRSRGLIAHLMHFMQSNRPLSAYGSCDLPRWRLSIGRKAKLLAWAKSSPSQSRDTLPLWFAFVEPASARSKRPLKPLKWWSYGLDPVEWTDEALAKSSLGGFRSPKIEVSQQNEASVFKKVCPWKESIQRAWGSISGPYVLKSPCPKIAFPPQADGPSIGQHHAGVAPAKRPAGRRSAVSVTDTDPCDPQHRSSRWEWRCGVWLLLASLLLGMLRIYP